MTSGLKAPILFVLDSRKLVTASVTEGCEWVIAGEYRAFELIDGRLCVVNHNLNLLMVTDGGKLKPPAGKSAVRAAFSNRLMLSGNDKIYPGEWVAIGPRVNRNPYSIKHHLLYPLHFNDLTEQMPNTDNPRMWVEMLLKYFRMNTTYYGILFERQNESDAPERCIVTCKQFGFKWPDKKWMRHA